MNRRAYSINEFGLAYGPKRSLTYKLLNEGKLKAVKVGKKRLILTDDAEAWLSSLRSSTHQIAAPLDGDSASRRAKVSQTEENHPTNLPRTPNWKKRAALDI